MKGTQARLGAEQLENQIQRDIRLAAGRAVPGCVLWRNNSGVAFHEGTAPVRYGVGKGGADLIGALTVKRPLTRRAVAILLAVEVKTATGRLSQDQRAFGALVERIGGVFIVARSVEDFIRQANTARFGLENEAAA